MVMPTANFAEMILAAPKIITFTLWRNAFPRICVFAGYNSPAN
jgi:hypothetical protein